MRGTTTTAITVALSCLLLAIPCGAQDREAARAAFDEASRQFEAGNHQLALDGFVRSRALMAGDARAQSLILFNIGRSQEELQLYDQAVRSFEEYLHSAPGDAPFRDQTVDRVRELRARLARGGGGGGSSASGGGPPVLVIAGGALAGLGALTVLAAIPTGVLALDGRKQLEDDCLGGSCPGSAQPLLDETATLGLVTDVLWITGVSLAAVGAALLVAGIATSDEAPALGAFCTGDGCAATLSARF
jgi:tetratricopeptide (TPR) repeat protein